MQKGNKGFMVLTKTECINATNHLLQNAESLYNDARLLASNNSYGSATSLLIQSIEETMKALILFLDGYGFKFRENVYGINNLFINHKLRYGLAMLLSISHIFLEDFKFLFLKIINDQNFFRKLSSDNAQMENVFIKYFKRKIEVIMQEVKWFSNAEFLRQDGFYVDYIDEIRTPLQIGRTEYEDVLLRADGMREIIQALIQSFLSGDESLDKHVDILKMQFINENWYVKIGKVVEKFKDKRTSPYSELTDFLIELEEDINKR